MDRVRANPSSRGTKCSFVPDVPHHKLLCGGSKLGLARQHSTHEQSLLKHRIYCVLQGVPKALPLPKSQMLVLALEFPAGWLR